MDIYGKFYNPTHIDSYNRIYNFSIGSRSIGKSTGWALRLLSNYMKTGEQFIYVRRTKDELDETAPSYFDNAVNILLDADYKIDKFNYKGRKYYVNDKVCGFAIPLSLQRKYKSADYSKVKYILYDEFMVMPWDTGSYIGGKTNVLAEVDAMASLYQTVDRCRGSAARNEVKVIFIGNAGTFFNPFFIHFEIDKYLRPDTKYLAPKNADYVLEFTTETEATKDIKNSNGYKISTNKTRDYAYNNKFADIANDAFILRKPEGRRIPLCNLIYDGKKYGVFSYPDAGYIYVNHEDMRGAVPEIAITTNDHRPNYLMMKTWHGSEITKLIKGMYDFGSIRFADYKCKMVIDFYLAYDV